MVKSFYRKGLSLCFGEKVPIFKTKGTYIMENTLGTRIATLRKEKGLTQEELAEKLGVSSQAVSKWENDLSCPDIMLLPQLSKIFDTTVDELLSGKKDEPAVRVVPKKERKNFDELMLRIKVDSDDGERVRVNIPLSIIKVTLECCSDPNIIGIGGNASSALGNIDFAQIIKLAESGMIGKIVEVDSGDGDFVEVFVE
jgi:transcriptional regulator with XRE-family HTH domain